MSKFSKGRLEQMIVNSLPSRSRLFFMALAFSLMAGCAVGPDFKQPVAPMVSDYTDHPFPETVTTTNVTGGEAQRFAKGGDIAGDWWTLFHSRPLNELIEQSLTNNPDLKAAQAALSVARENVLAQRGAYFPSVTGSFSASRQKQPETLAPVPSSNAFQYNLFTPQVSVSYSPDVFGAEPPVDGVFEGAGTGRAFPNDRDLYHADRERGGHGDSGGGGAGAD